MKLCYCVFMTNTNTVTASNARPSSYVELIGAVDVDVTVTTSDITVSGEVTLVPRQYDGRLAAYGAQPDHWISGALLQSLSGLDDAAFRAICGEIEAAACWEAE